MMAKGVGGSARALKLGAEDVGNLLENWAIMASSGSVVAAREWRNGGIEDVGRQSTATTAQHNNASGYLFCVSLHHVAHIASHLFNIFSRELVFAEKKFTHRHLCALRFYLPRTYDIRASHGWVLTFPV